MNRRTDYAALALQCLPTQVALQLPPPFGRTARARAGMAAPDQHLTLPYVAPPEALRAAHDHVLLQQFWSRLMQVVREPTLSIETGDIRWVQVAGSAVLAFMPDGTVHPYLFEPAADGTSGLAPLDAWTVVLQGCPYRNLWLKALARLASWEVQDHAAQRGVVLGVKQASDYADWAFANFGRQLARHADLRQMRSRVARVLAFEPAVVAMAARLPVTTRSDALILLGAYNRVQRHRAAFETLQREAPNLVPIFGALCDAADFPTRGQPSARLRKFLVEASGISPRCWRILCKDDGRVLKPLAEFYEGPVDDAALEHLRLLDLLGIGAKSPKWLVRNLLAGWGNADSRWASYCGDAGKHPDLWVHVVRMLSKPRQAAPAAIEFDLVRRWIFELPRDHAPDSPQRAAGWPWLVRQASEWAEALRRQAQGQRIWSTWTETVSVDRWELRPLNSALALWEEAVAMRHCAERYGDRCQAGESVMFSVFDGSRHVATALMDRTPQGWSLGQVKGFANQEVAPRLSASLAAWMAKLVVSDECEESTVLGSDGDVGGDPDDADVDEATRDRRLIADVVQMVHAESLKASYGPWLFSQAQAMLERWNDEGRLNYRCGGRQVLHEQMRDWTAAFGTWLDAARERGAISLPRYAALRRCRRPLDALLPDEWALFDAMFVEHIFTCEEPDGDVYGIWGAEELRDESGRSVWAVYRITCYSFSSVQFSLMSLCGDTADVKAALEKLGRYVGELPR